MSFESQPNIDIDALSATLMLGTLLVQQNATLSRNPELHPDSGLMEGLDSLREVNEVLETSHMIHDPMDIYFKESYPKVPIIEETAVSIAATTALDVPSKLKLFEKWAEAASRGRRSERIAPTKGLARIMGIQVVTDRYDVAKTKNSLRATGYVDAFITAVDYDRPIVGRLLRFKDRKILEYGVSRSI
jgi:hypothetical protein